MTRTFTLDDAHTFAQGLIANGWLNGDPDCVDTLHRQLVAIMTPPAGYDLAPSVATVEMQAAGQACGVNASWSYAKCYRAMLDAQPTIAVPTPVTSSNIAGRSDARHAIQLALEKCAAQKVVVSLKPSSDQQ